MNGTEDTKKNLPILKDDDRTYVYLQGSHFQQNDVIVTNNNNVINIYVVYKLDPISSTRNTDYTIQNALFGALKITKNTASSKNNYVDQWTTSESEKTGLYGNIYDFVVDHEAINGVKPIYDMHRYLMIKINISP